MVLVYCLSLPSNFIYCCIVYFFKLFSYFWIYSRIKADKIGNKASIFLESLDTDINCLIFIIIDYVFVKLYKWLRISVATNIMTKIDDDFIMNSFDSSGSSGVFCKISSLFIFLVSTIYLVSKLWVNSPVVALRPIKYILF